MGDIRRLRSTAHPIRLRILSLLTAEELSQGEIAKRLGKSQGVIGYHIQELVKAKKIFPAGKKIVRGGEAITYKYNLDSSESKQKSINSEQMMTIANELIRRSSHFRPGKQIFADLEFSLPKEDWDKAVIEIYKIVKKLHQQAVPENTPKSVKASLSIALFQTKRN